MIQVGDGATATFFESQGESIISSVTFPFYVEDEATLTLGEYDSASGSGERLFEDSSHADSEPPGLDLSYTAVGADEPGHAYWY